MKILFTIFILILPQASRAGVYDHEIAAVEKYMGEYIRQNQKNILALGKLASAYENVWSGMENVIKSRKLLQGRCEQPDRNKFKDCLAKQSVAITMLDLYTRYSGKLIEEAKADIAEAGHILGDQDMSGHLARIQGVGDDFKIWREESVPTLKKLFNQDRQKLMERYGDDYVKDASEILFRNADKMEAAFLGQEIANTSTNLYDRGMGFLGEHRLGRAKFTLEALKWLREKTPLIWKSITEDAARHPKIKAAIDASYKTIQFNMDRLRNEIEKRELAVEVGAAFQILKSKVEKASLSDRNVAAFKDLFEGYERLSKLSSSNKDALKEVLIERGFVWLEAVKP